MWNLRQLTLDFPPELIEGVMLPAAAIQQQQQASALLEQTQAHCDELLREAENQAAQILHQASLEAEQQIAQQRATAEQAFWQQTQRLFDDWHHARQQQDNQLLTRAQHLVTAAFSQLLAELPDNEKIHALLSQLLQASDRRNEATLFYHPQHEASLRHWFTVNPHLPWALRADEQQIPETLLLQTSQGEFTISWDSLQQRLLHLCS